MMLGSLVIPIVVVANAVPASAASSDYVAQAYVVDDGWDSSAFPEIDGLAIAVTKDSPDDLLAVISITPNTYAFDTADGGSAVIGIDINGDDQLDFLTMTPSEEMLFGEYQTPIGDARSGSVELMDVQATWLRSSDYYAVTIPWKSLGLKSFRVLGAFNDTYGDSDYTDWSDTITLVKDPVKPPAKPPVKPGTPVVTKTRYVVDLAGPGSFAPNTMWVGTFTESCGPKVASAVPCEVMPTLKFKAKGTTKWVALSPRSVVWKPKGVATIKVALPGSGTLQASVPDGPKANGASDEVVVKVHKK